MRPLLRLDAATVLKRFFHLERTLTVGLAAWVPHATSLETKAVLARAAWESSLTAEALRQRVFELRYPERDLTSAGDVRLIDAYERPLEMPAPFGALMLLSVAVGGLASAYATYLATADALADGPTHRFMKLALEEKARQREDLTAAAIRGREPDAVDDGLYEAVREVIDSWANDPFGPALAELPPTRERVTIPERAARDPRYFSCSFYWPDNFDPDYPYGEGVALQVRSAVSHINEVWATDTAAAILHAYDDVLGWEFTLDAARWLYDESRHMTMGRRRFEAWDIPAEEIPLGGYIYEAGAGRGPLHRLGMIAYFETKNIGKKVERAAAFGEIGDHASRRDMEFDWADEAIHAGYGRRWLRAALEVEGRSPDDWQTVVRECEDLVRARVARATDEEKTTVREQAERLLALCEERLR